VVILAMDTTAEYGSIALVRDGVVIEEVPMHSPEGFGQILFGHIQQLLDRHSLRVADVDCFASATGPGSFTGVRIGLAAAKGLGESAAKSVAGVSNLRAIAYYGQTSRRAVFLDARRGEIYGAVYDGDLQVVQDEVVTPFPKWLESLPEDCEFISPAIQLFSGVLEGAGRITRGCPRALAGAIGVIASRDEGAVLDPAALDANYVRRSDAELLWKES
jgi:tRNA threonylcarbamoyladenosine biosynthesis protein TsaB